MPNVFTEGGHTAEYIVSEANGTRSRDQITIASGSKLAAGTILGKVTTTEKYKAFNPAATDGTEEAAGILYAAVDATGGDKVAVAHVRDCEFNSALVIWPDGIDLPGKNTGLGQLAALGIIAR